MDIQSRLDQFRDDNPYDNDTQAKRLLASDDKDLILYVLALGFLTAKMRQRHLERNYIKNTGQTPPKERLVQGRVTGSVVPIKIKPSKRAQNAMQALIMDVWRIGGDTKLGDATHNDLAMAIKREEASAIGHQKNSQFYRAVQAPMDKDEKDEIVRLKWNDQGIREEIEKVYGEFRKTEAA